jgi:hypothetical protein
MDADDAFPQHADTADHTLGGERGNGKSGKGATKQKERKKLICFVVAFSLQFLLASCILVFCSVLFGNVLFLHITCYISYMP